MAPEALDLRKIFDAIIPFAERCGIKGIEISAERNVIMMPLALNGNHVGSMYAGALFTAAEMMGGAVAMTTFGPMGMIPIVKELRIKFLKPAKTDVTVSHTMPQDEVRRVIEDTEKNGKGEYVLNLEIKDANGVVVAVTEGLYQVRKIKDPAALMASVGVESK